MVSLYSWSGCTARLKIAAADADASVMQFFEPAGPHDSKEDE
jgi:hypothetical protein